MTETRAGPHVLRGASAPPPNGGQPLPEPARAFFEPRFGHDFSRVRVYADDHAAAESARRFHADAYTVGHDVVFGRGLYAPETAKGRALLAHELAHTIQPMPQPVIARQKSDQTVQRSFEPDVMVFHDAEKNRSLIFVDGLLVVEVHRLELPTLAEADARFDAIADAFTLEITTTRLYTIVTIAPGALEQLEKKFRNVTIKINQTDSQSGPVLGGEPISIEQPDPELARPGRRRKRVTESVERGVPSIAPEIPSSADESSPPSFQDLSAISEAEVAAAPEPEESELASAAIAVTDVVTDFIPFVSNFKDAIIAVTGINPVTRERVGWLDRVIAGVFAIPGVGNVLKFIGKGGKLLWKGLGSLAKTVKKLGKALERVGRTLGTALDESAEWISEKARNIWERVTAPLRKKDKPSTASAQPLKSQDTRWANPATLEDHFTRHGADFGAKNSTEYAQMASDFLTKSQADGLPTKIDSGGTIRVYDPKTNTLASYNPDGTTKTLYKPDPTKHKMKSNLEYWDSQPGKLQ